MSKRSLGGMSSMRNSERTAIALLPASRRICGHGPLVETDLVVL